MTILLLPGLFNSDAEHWQSKWEQQLPGAVRVQQQDWQDPQLTDWLAGLSSAVAQCEDEVWLVAHSLGCILAAHWLAGGQPGMRYPGQVRAALLVAPPDVGRTGFPATSFAPTPSKIFPIPVKIVASENDPWCDFAVAQDWARRTGATFHSLGAAGHINSESGLNDWKQGQLWLAGLQSEFAG